MHQTAVDPAAHNHLNQMVVDITYNLSLGSKFNMLVTVYITIHLSINDNIGYSYVTLHPAFLADNDDCFRTLDSKNIAFDRAVYL